MSFDGLRENQQVCNDLAVNRKILLTPEMLAQLYYLGVLVS